MPSHFRGHALVVSVNENAHDHLPDLGDCVRADGDLIERVLREEDACGYSPARVTRIGGSDATAAAITDAFDRLSTTVSPDDPILLFFSGHGDETSCDGSNGASLFPWDAEPDRCANVLTSGLLADLWIPIPARRKLAIVDACFSGGLRMAKSTAPRTKALSSERLACLSEGEGSVLISSSRSTEASWILPGDTASLFTKHLANGLLGHGGHDRDGFVRVFDLFNYVAVNVRRDAPQQSPVYAAYHQDLNFAVAHCSNVSSRKSPPTAAQWRTGFDQTQAISKLFESLYPLGPTDQAIWERAGGNPALLTLTGQGRADWFRAVRMVVQGGGLLTVDMLCRVALADYPRNRDLERLRDA